MMHALSVIGIRDQTRCPRVTLMAHRDGRPLTANHRFRGIADMAELAGLRCGKANDRCSG